MFISRHGYRLNIRDIHGSIYTIANTEPVFKIIFKHSKIIKLYPTLARLKQGKVTMYNANVQYVLSIIYILRHKYI